MALFCENCMCKKISDISKPPFRWQPLTYARTAFDHPIGADVGRG